MAKISNTHHITKNGKIKRNPGKKPVYEVRLYTISVDEDALTEKMSFDQAILLEDKYREDIPKKYDKLFINELIADWDVMRKKGVINESTFAGTEVWLEATRAYLDAFEVRYKQFFKKYVPAEDRKFLMVETDAWTPDWAILDEEVEDEDDEDEDY